jgi:hypothetical protein
MSCEHDEDECECIGDLDQIGTDILLNELKERGLLDVDRQAVEDAYDALLRGNTDEAAKLLKRALHPNGEADMIAIRVKHDLAQAAIRGRAA